VYQILAWDGDLAPKSEKFGTEVKRTCGKMSNEDGWLYPWGTKPQGTVAFSMKKFLPQVFETVSDQ